MQEAVPPGVGAMAALLKPPEGALNRILAEAAQGAVISAANLNSSDQIVIAGHAGAVERAAELAKAAGAKRAVMLSVSGQFASMCSTTIAKIPADVSVVPATRSVARGAGITVASDCRASCGTSRFQLRSNMTAPEASTANGRASSSNHSVHIRAEYHITIRCAMRARSYCGAAPAPTRTAVMKRAAGKISASCIAATKRVSVRMRAL